MFVFISRYRFKLLDKLLHIREVGCLEGYRRFSIDYFDTSIEEEVEKKENIRNTNKNDPISESESSEVKKI